jgi:subtilisin family serine protease
MRHMALFDIEGRPLSENDLPFASHGLAVSSMIAERGDIPERRGIASECNITFIDVSQDHNRVNWDFDKIRPAIDILVDEFEVDIINISGGSPLSLDDFRFPNVSRYYQEAVKYATNAGVLIVAAAGNKSYLPVALPARLPEVIGVGAIGRVGLAPKTSSTHDCQIKAQRSKGCYGTYGHTAFFHHVYTSYGDGMDMVGPGIGVVLGYEDGSVAEYDGTSYAAPYVTGVAACAFADVPGIGDVTGPQKHQTLRDHVLGLCKHLQMDPSRQGAGLPVLNEANLAGSIRT